VATLTVIPGIHAVKDYLGKRLGPSDWVAVTQERIDRFADATDDHQWIHVDPERARRESPFGGPVAHGYLTLSLAPSMLNQILRVEGEPTVLNTGISRMKLSAPVPAGSRVRLSCEIARAREMPGGGMRAVFRIAIEVEGTRKPALTADLGLVYAPPGGRDEPA
jgi:acyl dehydratase